MSTDGRGNKRLWVFLGVAYGLSWVFWIPAAVSGQDVTATAWIVALVLGGFGPSVAGIMMVYRSRGKEGRRHFWKRVVDSRRISAGWHAFIALVFPAVFAISFLVDTLLGGPVPEFETLAHIAANPLALVGMVVGGIITGPLSEELGWRGYALDRLQAQWSPFASSLILALVWWVWHLPLFLMQGTTQYTYGLGTPSFWLYLMAIVPLSVLLTWVCKHNSGSILAAILLHFTYNLTVGLVHPFSVRVNLFQAILLWIVAGGVALVDRARRD